MTSFLDLPREIRDIVYIYSLRSQCRLGPNLRYYAKRLHEDRPGVALLSVSKILREESLPIFFEKNTWVVPIKAARIAKVFPYVLDCRGNKTRIDPLVQFDTDHVYAYFCKYGHLIHCLVLEFQRQDWQQRHLVPAQPVQWHDRMIDELMVPDWKFKNDVLAVIPNLRILVIDIDSCLCPLGCCTQPVLSKIASTMTTPIGKDVNVYVSGTNEKTNTDALKRWRNRHLDGAKGHFELLRGSPTSAEMLEGWKF